VLACASVGCNVVAGLSGLQFGTGGSDGGGGKGGAGAASSSASRGASSASSAVSSTRAAASSSSAASSTSATASSSSGCMSQHTPAPAGCGAASTWAFQDDFACPSTDWAATLMNGTAVPSSGEVTFTIDGTAQSDARWTWSGSAASIIGCQAYIGLVTGVGTTGAGIAFLQITNASASGDAVAFWNNAGQLLCVHFEGDAFAGGVTCSTVTYDPVAHRYLRFRESAGTLYWETSPDASTWNQFGSMATPAWAGSVTASFGLSNGNTAGPMTSAVFGPINLP